MPCGGILCAGRVCVAAVEKIEPASQNSSEADPGSQNMSETFEYLMNILQCPGYDSDECMCNVLVTMLPTQVLYSLECFMSCIIW